MGKLPAFLFYPRDWLIDPELCRCTVAARGVLMDVLCLMFESNPRGILQTNGTAWTLQEVARALRGPYRQNLKLLGELVKKAALGLTDSGALYSRRMVKDEERRQQDAARQRNHRASGHAPVTGMSHGKTSGLHTPGNANVTPPVTGLSHRSSFSSSLSNSKPFTPVPKREPKRGWVNPDEQRRNTTRDALNRVFGNPEKVASDVQRDVPKKPSE